MIFGRGRDRSVALAMKDQEGRPRIVMQVHADGTPRLQFLNVDGEVVNELP